MCVCSQGGYSAKTYRIAPCGGQSEAHHSLDLGLVGRGFELVHLDAARLDHEDAGVARVLGERTHQAWVVVDLRPLGERGA